MRVVNLHELPKLRDSLSYIYIEHAIVEQKASGIQCASQEGVIQIPAAALAVLIIGPGTSITHAAVKTLADNGVSILWTGEEITRFYAFGIGETRKAYHLIRQAELVSDPQKREEVVLRMYHHRFKEDLPPGLSLPQIRGLEGVRVRTAYQQAARDYGIEWHGRHYDRGNWQTTDPPNRALSAGNALLNALCHAAILAGGYAPGLGFIHTGKQLSFVYDIADLYKIDLVVPIAFEMAARYPGKPESYMRTALREKIRETRLLERILPDIDALLQIEAEAIPEAHIPDALEADPALPVDLWAPLMNEE
ncbi:MAG: type I-E CRISPR-associated endonuclease Cas1e [Anaerolineales bacterium]